MIGGRSIVLSIWLYEVLVIIKIIIILNKVFNALKIIILTEKGGEKIILSSKKKMYDSRVLYYYLEYHAIIFCTSYSLALSEREEY